MLVISLLQEPIEVQGKRLEPAGTFDPGIKIEPTASPIVKDFTARPRWVVKKTEALWIDDPAHPYTTIVVLPKAAFYCEVAPALSDLRLDIASKFEKVLDEAFDYVTPVVDFAYYEDGSLIVVVV